MKVEKSLTINIGGYQSIKIGAVDCDTFADADAALQREIIELERKMGIELNNTIKMAVSNE